MPEEKKCPFNEKLACSECRLFCSILGQTPECVFVLTARKLSMLYVKGDRDGVPFYGSRG